MKIKPTLLAGFCTLALILFSVSSALAIPAFSREYKTECTTCHTIFPERNEFGDAFEKNSYVWPGELPAKHKVDPNLSPEEKKRAEALYLSGLPEVIPVSFQGEIEATYVDNDTPAFDLGKSGVEMFVGGNFREKVGFFSSYHLRDGASATAFLQFRHLADTPINVKVGQFSPKLRLWNGNDRSSVSGFGNSRLRVGDNPFRLSTRQSAVELNAVLGSRLYLAAGITNGVEEDKDTKEYYGHASVRVGGTDFLGREPDIDLDHDSVWDFLTLTFGTFGYSGSSAAGTADANTDDFYRAGLEGEVLYKRFKLRVSTVFGHDDDPEATGTSLDSRYYLAHVQYLIGSNLMPSFRFEHQDIDGDGITRKYIPCVTYAYQQNLRMGLQYTRTDAPDGTEEEAVFQIAFAF